MSPGTALLAIDVQQGAFDGVRMPPLVDGDALLDTLDQLIEHARRAGAMVVFVQDDGRVGGAFEPGTAHWALHDRLDGEGLVVRKARPSAFEGTGLADRLRAMGVERVVVCGLHSEGCVTATATHALASGFAVTLVADAHGTADAASAARIIAETNARLAALGARVVPVDRVARSGRGPTYS